MADFNSSLPIRTENNGDVAAKIVDGTVTSQAMSVDASGRIVVKLDDGSGNLITSQANGSQRALDVGINVAGVQIDPRSIRALTSSDVVTAAQGAPNTTANSWPVKITDGTNVISLTAAGEVKVSITQPLPTGANVIGAVTQSGTWTVATNGDGSVSGGAAGTKSILSGGVFTSATGLTTPLTAGQQAALQVDANGRLLVDIPTASAITVNQGTSPWIVADLSDGATANGAAGTKSTLSGLIYLSAPPVLTSGNQNSLLGDVSGNLLVNLKTALPAGANTIGSVGVTNLPTTVDTNFGTVGASTIRNASQIGNATGPADFNSGATGAQTLRVVANQGAANATPWNENISQVGGAAIALGQTTMSASLPVTIASNQSAIQVVGNVADGATDSGNSVKVGGVYNSTLPTLTTGQRSSLELDSSGRLITVIGAALPAGANVIGAVTQSGTWTVNSKTQDGSGTAITSGAQGAKQALDVELNANGAVVSTANPIPVTISNSVPGAQIESYQTSVALAAGANVTLSYTVTTGKTLTLQQVAASASGKIRMDLIINATTKVTSFNSTSTPNIDFAFSNPSTVASALVVGVKITNLDKQPFDVYATIFGVEN